MLDFNTTANLDEKLDNKVNENIYNIIHTATIKFEENINNIMKEYLEEFHKLLYEELHLIYKNQNLQLTLTNQQVNNFQSDQSNLIQAFLKAIQKLYNF